METSLEGLQCWCVWDTSLSNQHTGTFIGRSNSINGKLTPNHMTPTPVILCLLICSVIELGLFQTTIRWYSYAAFINLCFEKLAPSRVRVRSIGRSKRFEDKQGQSQTQLLGQKAGSQRRKCVLPLTWRGRKGRPWWLLTEVQGKKPENSQGTIKKTIGFLLRGRDS